MTSFDRARCEIQGFVFETESATSQRVISVKLDGMGPKLLVSDEVIGPGAPILRWRFKVPSHVEIGVVPEWLQDDGSALHTPPAHPPVVGFCSATTKGSVLPSLSMGRGSVVEMLASNGRLRCIVTTPRTGVEFRFEQPMPSDVPYKLAVTCWARASFNLRV